MGKTPTTKMMTWISWTIWKNSMVMEFPLPSRSARILVARSLLLPSLTTATDGIRLPQETITAIATAALAALAAIATPVVVVRNHKRVTISLPLIGLFRIHALPRPCPFHLLLPFRHLLPGQASETTLTLSPMTFSNPTLSPRERKTKVPASQ